MSIRDVLVHVKSYEPWSEHIDVTGRIARAFGARLTGLWTLRDIAMLKTILGADAPAVLERQSKDRHASLEAEKTFRDFLEHTGIVGDWQIGEGDASDLLSWAARFHDLLVVEQTDPETDETGWDVAEQCALTSGKPTLVVPFQGRFPTVGRRILIAWNGSREAALAVHGALPFLAAAEQTTLLFGRGKDGFSSITRYPDLNVTDYLRRHGVDVATRPFDVPDEQAGSGILDAAHRCGADLIVMGAYGRSWFREWVLGGATRYVLGNMHTPVLMAH
jgi:hypothetical protein